MLKTNEFDLNLINIIKKRETIFFSMYVKENPLMLSNKTSIEQKNVYKLKKKKKKLSLGLRDPTRLLAKVFATRVLKG